MRVQSQPAFMLLLALISCALEPTNSGQSTWYPIPGVSVVSEEQARVICGPILQQWAIAGRRGARAAENARAQHRACMGQHGWTDQAPKARNDARSTDL